MITRKIFVCGPGWWRLSGHALSKMDLRELARPRLTQLMDTTGLLCHLGIIDNGSAYYILKVESSATISVRSHEGKSLSLYRSGIGKCLLAWQPAAVQQSIIEGLVWEQAFSLWYMRFWVFRRIF